MNMLYAFLSVFLVLTTYHAFPWIHGRYKKDGLRRKAGNKNAVVLTFDDGPGGRLTPQILDILEEKNLKATFFLLGRNIQGREDIVRRIVAQGSEVASHGYDHLNYWFRWPLTSIKDINNGWRSLDEATGVSAKTYPFRPPYGKLDIFGLLYLLARRVPVCYWTIVSGDTFLENSRSPDHAASVLETEGGGVVLAHDFDRDHDHTDEFVLQSIRKTIDCVERLGLKVMTFSELESK